MESQSKINQLVDIISTKSNAFSVVKEPGFFDQKLGGSINPYTINASIEMQNDALEALNNLSEQLKSGLPNLKGPYLQTDDDGMSKNLRAFFKDKDSQTFDTFRIQLFPNQEIVIQKSKELAQRIGGEVLNNEVS